MKITYQEIGEAAEAYVSKATFETKHITVDGNELKVDGYFHDHAKEIIKKVYIHALKFANNHKSESIAKSFDDAWQSCGFEEPERCDSHSVYMFKMGHEKGFEAGLKQGGENG